jgi:hypothetical protein
MGGSGAAGSLYDCMGRYRMFLLLFLFDWVNPSANNILIGSYSEGGTCYNGVILPCVSTKDVD